MDWSNLLSAFIGTFVGAYVAFKLESNARAAEKIAQQATDGNLALLTLSQMFNSLKQFQKEVIATAPERTGRWMRMTVTFPQSPNRVSFDPSRLAFLLEHEDQNLLPEVLLEEQRFHLIMDMISRRTHLMLERIYPMLSAAGVQPGRNVPEPTIRGILGPALFAEIDTLTESLVVHVNEDVDSLKTTFWKLRDALVKLVPEQKFIRVDFDATAPSEGTPIVSTESKPKPWTDQPPIG